MDGFLMVFHLMHIIIIDPDAHLFMHIFINKMMEFDIITVQEQGQEMKDGHILESHFMLRELEMFNERTKLKFYFRLYKLIDSVLIYF